MTIIFAAFGRYAGFEHSVRAARKRGGADVVVLTDHPGYIEDSQNIQTLWYKEPPFRGLENSEQCYWLATTQLRWLATNAYVKEKNLRGAIICPDWDIVLFSDVMCATAHLKKHPVCLSKEVDSSWSAGWVINDDTVLDDYCVWLHHAVETKLLGPRIEQYNDMATWLRFTEERGIQIGNLADISNSGTFDHNIHCGVGKYVFDGPAKRVTWIDGNPYFTLLDGTQVRAHSIHCWGTYKNREVELCKKAGI